MPSAFCRDGASVLLALNGSLQGDIVGNDIKSLFADITTELDEEKVKQRTPEEARLHDVAQKLLLLARELRTPGSARSTEDRATVLLDAISKEDF